MIKLNIQPNPRYERKFTAHDTERALPLAHIRRHPALFRSIFEPRIINNIYLDTNNFQFYHNNKIGIAERKKIRIRWYGQTFGQIQNPKLEYKLKSSLVGDKWVFDLKSFQLNAGFDGSQLQKIFEQSDLPQPILDDLRQVQPTLLNSYFRTYFLSANTNYRLTFDEQMKYYKIDKGLNHFMEKYQDSHDFILELKYTPEHDHSANQITQHLPYRLNKSSKYVNGIDYISPKQNR